MRKKKNHEGDNSQTRMGMSYSRTFIAALNLMVIVVFLAGCSKDDMTQSSMDDLLTTAGVEEIFPANSAESVEINPVIGVTFKTGTAQSKIAATTLTLKKGNVTIPGTITFAGTSALFSYGDKLTAMSEYTATLLTTASIGSEEKPLEYSWRFKTGKENRDNSLSVVSVSPEDHATNVPLTTTVTVTVNKEIKSWMKGLISVILKAGNSPVSGTLSFADKIVTFTPSGNLVPGTVYSARFRFGANGSDNEGDDDEGDDDDGDDDDDDDDDDGDDKSSSHYSWSFTTVTGVPAGGPTADITAPVINAVSPLNGATSVPTSSKVTATFSEPMSSSTVTSTTFNLKQGATAIAGTVTMTGNIATFTPSSALSAGTLYTATVTNGVKDVAGNAMAANYSWNFTTASQVVTDVTPPTVQSVTPASNATSVAVSSKITATFSEPMNSATVTTTTFTLKQGTTTVPGTVTMSGNTATYTPSAALTGGTVYTATITTGAMDLAGNTIAGNYTWNFTTAAVAPAGLSFSADVVPVLNLCNNCHTHPWTTSSNASTFYNNLVSGGYVNPTSYTSSKIYIKLTGGHPGGNSISTTDINKILNWMKEGSKNN